MNQNSENKQFMYDDDYRDVLNDFISELDVQTMHDWLFDYIFEYMEKHMTVEQVKQFIDTGEW